MIRSFAPVTLRGALLAGGLSLLSACAHDANSDLAMDTLSAADSAMSVMDLGYAAAERGDHTSAIQYFRAAHARNLAYSTADGGALLGLAQSLLAIGQNADAAKVFIKAAKAGGGGPALRGLAQAQLHLGQPALAAESARRAIQLDPNDARSMGILGISLDVMGDHRGAADVYSDAMDRFPASMALASNHGLSMVMTGDMDMGTRLLEDVVRDGRAKARDRQNLALAYALGGDYDKAAALSAIDLDVSGVRANLLFADMLRAMSPKARLSALVLGSQAPQTDNSQNANAVYLKGDNAAWVDASIRRLVPQEGSADLAGVPPLMDPTGWAVQIAAYRKLEHLAPGWAYLSSKYASIIGGLEPRRSEVTHPPAPKGPVGFFYRLNAGPLRSKEEALDICKRLEARGAECWVRPPTAGEGRLPSEDMAQKSSDAESAFVKSQDYNAVVNQFARSVVMKSRGTAPSQAAPEPAPAKVQMAKAAPQPEMPSDEQKAAAEPAPMQQDETLDMAAEVPEKNVPAAMPDVAQDEGDTAAPAVAQAEDNRSETQAETPAPQPEPLVAELPETQPQVTEAVDAVSEPQPSTPIAEPVEAAQETLADVRVDGDDVAPEQPSALEAQQSLLEDDLKAAISEAKEADEKPVAAVETVSQTAVPAQEVPEPMEPRNTEPQKPEPMPASVTQAAAMEPAAGPAMAATQAAAALLDVFEAVEQAQALPQAIEPPVRLPIEPVKPDSALTQAPSPGKLIPAMKRFNDTPQNLNYINMSGDIRPGFQDTGVPVEASESVDQGVY